MSSSILSLDDIIESAEVNEGKCLFRQSTWNHKPRVSYMGVEFLDATQTWRKYNKLNTNMQVLPGGAKEKNTQNYSTDKTDKSDKRTSDKAQITFYKLEKADLDRSDYKECNYKELLDNNAKLIKAFDIIVENYIKCCENVIDEVEKRAQNQDDDDDDDFVLKSRVITQFRQTTRKFRPTDKGKGLTIKRNAKKEKVVNLDKYLYRIVLPGKGKNGKICHKYGEHAEERDIVFDMRKSDIDKKELVPAVVKVNVLKKKGSKKSSKKKTMPLTVSNVHNFITPMSLGTGKINFSQIKLSQFGFSLDILYDEITVLPHKKMKNLNIDIEALSNMKKFSTNYNSDEDDDDEEPDDEEVHTKTIKTKSDDESEPDDPDTIDEPGDNQYNDGSDDALEEQDIKPKKKKKKRKKNKSRHVSDEEESDS
jgi:hypothetical protein